MNESDQPRVLEIDDTFERGLAQSKAYSVTLTVPKTPFGIMRIRVYIFTCL